MSHIIVAFGKRENAANIRNVLVRSGMEVSAACLTGTKVLQYTDTWNEGVIICGYALQDMQYTELREYLPESFQILPSGRTVCLTEWWDFPCRSRYMILSIPWR